MPGALSSSNRSQVVYKLEGTYPTGFGVTPGGNGTKLNMLSESLDYQVKTLSSKTIRSDRQVPDIVQVSAMSQGGINFEHVYKENDPFILGVLGAASWFEYGTAGVGAVVATLTLASGTITAGAAPVGASAFTTLNKGQWFVVIPDAGASDAVKAYFASRPFRVSGTVAPSSTVITLDAATPINTAIAGASLTNAKLATSRAANGSVLKSYTLELQHEDITQYRQYLGMIPSKMDLKLQVGEIITGGFEFLGKSFTLAGLTVMGTPNASQTFTPANATRGVFDIIEGGASITATTYIKSADLTIDNTLREQSAVGVFGLAGVAPGTMNITGKMEVYFADATMYTKLISGAASSLSIPVLDVDGNGYVYTFPRIKYTAAKVAVGGLDQDNMLAMDFQALPDIDPTSPTFNQSVAIYRVGV